ncbi:LytTR family DNA-binding domain-containing protein [Caulobacter segnis]
MSYLQAWRPIPNVELAKNEAEIALPATPSGSGSPAQPAGLPGISSAAARISFRWTSTAWSASPAPTTIPTWRRFDRSHLVRMTLAQFEKTLDAALFVRVHRSSIVNVDMIERAEPAGGGRMLLHMANGQVVQASRAGSATLAGVGHLAAPSDRSPALDAGWPISRRSIVRFANLSANGEIP